MTALFAGGTSWQKLKRILGLTFQHARNLGSFVLIYKAVLALGRVLYKRLGIPMDGGPGVGRDCGFICDFMIRGTDLLHRNPPFPPSP